MLSFFDIFSCNINAYFQLLLSAVYAVKIEFSVLTLMPSQRSSVIHRLQTRLHEDGTSDFLLGNDHWEPSLDCRQDGLAEQLHSHRELAEQRRTCALVHFHEKVKVISDNFRHCFCLMTSSNWNVGSV